MENILMLNVRHHITWYFRMRQDDFFLSLTYQFSWFFRHLISNTIMFWKKSAKLCVEIFNSTYFFFAKPTKFWSKYVYFGKYTMLSTLTFKHSIDYALRMTNTFFIILLLVLSFCFLSLGLFPAHSLFQSVWSE